MLEENAPSVYSAELPALPVGSYPLTIALPSALGGQRRVLVDVPYQAEYLPTALGRSTLGQLAEQTGGRLLAQDDPGAIAGDSRALRVPLLVARSRALPGVGRGAHARAQDVQAIVTASSSACASSSSSGCSSLRTRR